MSRKKKKKEKKLTKIIYSNHLRADEIDRHFFPRLLHRTPCGEREKEKKEEEEEMEELFYNRRYR